MLSAPAQSKPMFFFRINCILIPVSQVKEGHSAFVQQSQEPNQGSLGLDTGFFLLLPLLVTSVERIQMCQAFSEFLHIFMFTHLTFSSIIMYINILKVLQWIFALCFSDLLDSRILLPFLLLLLGEESWRENICQCVLWEIPNKRIILF